MQLTISHQPLDIYNAPQRSPLSLALGNLHNMQRHMYKVVNAFNCATGIECTASITLDRRLKQSAPLSADWIALMLLQGTSLNLELSEFKSIRLIMMQMSVSYACKPVTSGRLSGVPSES